MSTDVKPRAPLWDALTLAVAALCIGLALHVQAIWLGTLARPGMASPSEVMELWWCCFWPRQS